MKKINYILLLLISLLVVPLVTACNDDSTKQLSMPMFVEMMDDIDNQILVTEKNVFASGYVFGICEDSELKDDLSKYIRFETVGTDNNFLDVSNIFVAAKTYYFYAQAIGSGDYTNSVFSKPNSFDNSSKLVRPTISNNNNIITWNIIQNAISYDVYIDLNDGLGNQKVANTTNTFYNLNTEFGGNYLNSSSIVSIQVVAVAPENTSYINSGYSNKIKLTKHLTPVAPVIEINGSVVSWNNVKNAVSYEVEIKGVGSKIIPVTTNSINLSYVFNEETQEYDNLVENAGEYSIKVRSIGMVENSDFGNTVNYTSSQQLSSPTINSVSLNQTYNQIRISVTVLDENTKSLTIRILNKNNEEVLLDSNVQVSSEFIGEGKSVNIIYSFNEINSNYSSLLNGTVKICANQVGIYYTPSNYATTLIS